MKLTFSFIIALLVHLPQVEPILDDDILYDIVWNPEAKTPVAETNSFEFISNRKEKYNCILPTPKNEFQKSADSVLVRQVEPLLKDFHSKTLCTYRPDPYWIYEFCHGTHIRQFHETKLAGKKTVVQEYYLGYYRAEDQERLTNADDEPVLKIHYKKINDHDTPMLALRYTQGTPCEINANRPRETIVYYVCREKNHDEIVHFQEISSCSYEMIIASNWLCRLPVFRPAQANRYSIDCSPEGNARPRPYNLRRLEGEQKDPFHRGRGAQFTMTSPDGTTIIITYDYVKDVEMNDLTDTIRYDVNQPTTTPASSPSSSISKSDRDFLEEFFSGRQCLSGGVGWWKQEICYGKHVIQYHDEPNHRTSITLGLWNEEKHLEWFKTTKETRSISHRKERQYVSLYYTGGDVCESTGKARVVEVKLKCSKKTNVDSPTSLYLVEPDTCSFILGIESPLFCNLIDFINEHGIPDTTKFIASIP